jgi:ABC-type Fe3+/spermidine/putrescine transport system ATPase subunit
MAGTPFLQAKAVSKIYPGAHQSGIRNISLIIKQGQITAIIGESGSGKSTLLRLFYGLLSPDNGEIHFKKERVWGPEVKLIPGHEAMNMVTQSNDDLNLFAKVWENVAAMLPHTDLKFKQEKTDKTLKQLKMAHLAEKRVADLSGGEKQRVSIARALITNPAILLLDEPFNQVDTSFREGLQHDIREIVKETGLTVIIVSHDPEEVLSMAHELLVLKDGEIVEAGSPKTLYQNPQNLYTARLLTNCNVLNADEAKICGIKASTPFTVIYPEWVKTSRSKINVDWTVSQILFKGCYEDLLMEKDGLRIRLLNDQFGKYNEGDHVSLKIKKWLTF